MKAIWISIFRSVQGAIIFRGKNEDVDIIIYLLKTHVLCDQTKPNARRKQG